MHLTNPLTISLLLTLTTIRASTITTNPSPTHASTCPFSTPLATLATSISQEDQPDLRIRQAAVSTAITVSGSCPNGYFGCSNVAAPQACCSSTAICTTDVVNHVACCASGASCTGVIGAGTMTDNGGGAGVTVTYGSTVVSTNGIIVTAGPATNGAAARATGAMSGAKWFDWLVVGVLVGVVGV